MPELPPVMIAVFSLIGPRLARGANLGADEHLEAAPEHALAVERMVLGVHHAGETWIFHDLRHALVARGPRLVDHVGEHHGLVLLELYALRKRRDLTGLHVVGDA